MDERADRRSLLINFNVSNLGRYTTNIVKNEKMMGIIKAWNTVIKDEIINLVKREKIEENEILKI
jgi:hypothetical protein